MWQVESSDEYDSWFKLLDEESKEAVLERVLLLAQFGPNLPRPYSDVLKGSKKYKAQLRAEMQVKQSDMTNFTQSSVSKIEKRKDIKISTLIGTWTVLVWGWKSLPIQKPLP